MYVHTGARFQLGDPAIFCIGDGNVYLFLPVPASPTNPRRAQVLQDTTVRIGPSMSRILASRDHAQDPLFVQLALQGCILLCIACALNSFCIGFPSKSDAVLAQIYGSMHRAEPQPTSARWRTLTHQHIHTIYLTSAISRKQSCAGARTSSSSRTASRSCRRTLCAVRCCRPPCRSRRQARCRRRPPRRSCGACMRTRSAGYRAQ